jgi:hypothetical protein
MPAAILNLRSKPGPSHQQYGKEAPGGNVERKTETRPPHRHPRILNDQMMKEVEHSVPREASRGQPKVLLEACHSHHEKAACDQSL